MRKVPEYRKQLARKLRHESTESEQLLWQLLRNNQLDNLKFRRQRPLARYIADFCCDHLKLIIELDGKGHQEEDQQSYDHERDHYLSTHGYTTLRLPSSLVIYNPQQALTQIRQTAKELQTQRNPNNKDPKNPT